MKFIICQGLPASGKSTWAKAEVAKDPKIVLVNRDTLRLQNPGKSEKVIRTLRNALLEEAFANKVATVISDDTNLRPQTFQELKELGEKYGYTVETKDFTYVPVTTCIERDAARTPNVGEKVIMFFYNSYLNGKKRQPVQTHNALLPDCIICDLDGTLALFNGRGPFDTAKCETDILSIPVARVLEATRLSYLQQGKDFRIILMSGREDKFRPHTERWLKKNNVYYDELHMRSTKDFRKDAIVKRELYEANIKGKYNPLFLLDDRDQVVRMWRHDLNLVVFQVAEGNF